MPAHDDLHLKDIAHRQAPSSGRCWRRSSGKERHTVDAESANLEYAQEILPASVREVAQLRPNKQWADGESHCWRSRWDRCAYRRSWSESDWGDLRDNELRACPAQTETTWHRARVDENVPSEMGTADVCNTCRRCYLSDCRCMIDTWYGDLGSHLGNELNSQAEGPGQAAVAVAFQSNERFGRFRNHGSFDRVNRGARQRGARELHDTLDECHGDDGLTGDSDSAYSEPSCSSWHSASIGRAPPQQLAYTAWGDTAVTGSDSDGAHSWRTSSSWRSASRGRSPNQLRASEVYDAYHEWPSDDVLNSSDNVVPDSWQYSAGWRLPQGRSSHVPTVSLPDQWRTRSSATGRVPDGCDMQPKQKRCQEKLRGQSLPGDAHVSMRPVDNDSNVGLSRKWCRSLIIKERWPPGASRRDESARFPEALRETNVVPRFALPCEKDRNFMRLVNKLVSSTRSPGFGYTGHPIRSPAVRRAFLAFAKACHHYVPELGSLHTACGGSAVDPTCGFWSTGRTHYLSLISKFLHLLGSDSISKTLHHDLLADLGFYVIPNVLTAREEEELLSYWRPGGPVYGLGAYESGTNRCFFHYGPILKRKTALSSKSTLGIIPGKFGSMPPVVGRMGLRQRIWNHISNLGLSFRQDALEFDQLYVNHYSTKHCSGIGFHHDNPKTMMGVIVGLSLGNSCQLHLIALDQELSSCTPIVVKLPPRSMYLMTGLSRYHLQHGIPELCADRLSLTFRTVNPLCAERSLWQRSWAEIPPNEASNAHWPLLPPVHDESEMVC